MPPPNNNLFEQNGMMPKRFGNSSATLGPILGDLGGLGSAGSTPNPYEKWSNGTDKMFMNGGNGGESVRIFFSNFECWPLRERIS